MAAPGLPHHLTVLSQVVVGHTVNGLAVSDASQVIGVADNMAALGGFGQLPYGAAGTLNLRHPKNTHLCFFLFSTLFCLLTHFFLIFKPFCPKIRSTLFMAHSKSTKSVRPHCSAHSIRRCISVPLALRVQKYPKMPCLYSLLAIAHDSLGKNAYVSFGSRNLFHHNRRL